MISKKNLNSLKYSDYGDPILQHKSDYRTSTSRAHRSKLSLERNFVPQNTHQLCSELQSSFHDYRPKSETSNQFLWKINPHRKHREDLAISSGSAHYNHQFTDKVKTSAPIAPLNFYRSRHTDVSPFSAPLREPVVREREVEPKIEILDKSTHHYTNTEGYFPRLDQLVSMTQLDYHQHANYATARTNLIVSQARPFNADSTFFMPRSKLIYSYPMRGQYLNEITRDKSKFSQANYDRMIPNRSAFVSSFGLTTEMSSNY